MELLRQPPYDLEDEVLNPLLVEHEEGSLPLLEKLIEDKILPKWERASYEAIVLGWPMSSP